MNTVGLKEEACQIYQLKRSSNGYGGGFSAFPKEIRLEEVLKYDYPYADGYKGFWKNPIALQHPLAVSEIVVWDGSLILVISQKSEVVNALIENNTFVQDLEKYNME